MPCALHAVGVDRNEQVLYAGGADGRLFAKDLVVPAGVATAEHPLGAELSEELPGHSQAVTGIEFGPEGLQMFSGSLDGQVRMWDMESHQTLRTFDLQSPVACIRVFPAADFDRGAQQDREDFERAAKVGVGALVVGGVLATAVTGAAIYGVVKLVKSRDKGDERKGKGR